MDEIVQDKFVGFVFHPSGRKRELERADGSRYLEDLPVEEFVDYPHGIKKKHLDVLGYILVLSDTAAAAGREVALLQEEILRDSSVDKYTLKLLEGWKLIEARFVFLKMKGGRNLGGHKGIVLTPRGRALLKHLHETVKAQLEAGDV